MKQRTSRLSSLLRLILALLTLGQAIYAPVSVYASAPISIRVNPSTVNPPNQVTGINAMPDYSAPEDKGKLQLQWRAPSAEGGNDDVFSYVIRYATFSVSDIGGSISQWWSHPGCLTALGQDLPSSWGIKSRVSRNNIETVQLTGLKDGVVYYFGIKAIDRYKRASAYDDPLSGVITQAGSYATSPPWTPSIITNLTALSTFNRGQVSLEWTAPLFIDTAGVSVNGRIRYPGEYCIQYSTSHQYVDLDGSLKDIPELELYRLNNPNNSNNWSASTRVFVSTQNITTGDLQKSILTGLNLNTTYYFHIFTRNEWPNKWSNASVTAYARPYALLRSIASLTAIAGASSSTNIGNYNDLIWTNPSAEPNLKGTRICYSTSEYPNSFTWPNYIDLEPQLMSQATNYQHIQLVPRTTYFYTLYAYDNAGYYSEGITTAACNNTDLIAPDLVQNLTSLINVDSSSGTDEYLISLNWTTPPSAPLYRNSDYQGVKIYFSTFTTNTAQHAYLADITGTNGSVQQYLHHSLNILTTYYYSLQSYDLAGNSSTVRATAMQYISEQYIPPSKPLLITAIGSSALDINTGNNIYLRWTSPAEPQTSGVRIVVRTDRPASSVADIQNASLTYNWAGGANVTANYTFKQLLTNTTYFISLYAESKYGLFSKATTSYLTITVPWTDSLAPFEPRGVKIAQKSGSARKLSWHTVEHNADYTRFADASAPRIDELMAYRIYRSSSIVGDGWYQIGLVMAGTNSFTDTLPDNRVYFYKVRSVDASGNYSDSTAVSSEGDTILVNSDGSYLWMTELLSRALSKEYNTYGADISIRFNNTQTEEIGPVIKSMEWTAYKLSESNGTTSLAKVDGFNLAAAAKADTESADMGLSYAVATGNSAISAVQRASARLTPQQIAAQVSMYYYNGVEWMKVGGKVNEELSAVSTKVKFAGKYQLRLASPATEFTFYGVLPKIVTPNNDGQNDKALFRFANPKGSLVSVKIYDVKGALVRKLEDTARSSDDQSGAGFISWDATDTDNQLVAPGVYLYQLEGEGKTVNGTVVVAR